MSAEYLRPPYYSSLTDHVDVDVVADVDDLLGQQHGYDDGPLPPLHWWR